MKKCHTLKQPHAPHNSVVLVCLRLVYVTDFYFYIYRFTMQHHNSLSVDFAKLLSASLTVQILRICLETIWSSRVINNLMRSLSATMPSIDLVAPKGSVRKLVLKFSSSVIGVPNFFPFSAFATLRCLTLNTSLFSVIHKTALKQSP